MAKCIPIAIQDAMHHHFPGVGDTLLSVLTNWDMDAFSRPFPETSKA
jgi:hypothetical protein